MDKITVETQLSRAEFVKANLLLFYSKWVGKFTAAIGILILLSLISLLGSLTEFPWIPLGLGLYFTIGLPIHIYFAAKKNFEKDRRISELILYTFDRKSIEMKGESFHFTFDWDKIYSITGSKDFIIIWQSPHVVNLVPKKDFKQYEFAWLKTVVEEHQHYHERKLAKS